MRVKAEITEMGPEAMTATGHCWIGKDGRILKIAMELLDPPIPLAGWALNGEIFAQLID